MIDDKSKDNGIIGMFQKILLILLLLDSVIVADLTMYQLDFCLALELDDESNGFL
jgi:hypothetical protein